MPTEEERKRWREMYHPYGGELSAEGNLFRPEAWKSGANRVMNVTLPKKPPAYGVDVRGIGEAQEKTVDTLRGIVNRPNSIYEKIKAGVDYVTGKGEAVFREGRKFEEGFYKNLQESPAGGMIGRAKNLMAYGPKKIAQAPFWAGAGALDFIGQEEAAKKLRGISGGIGALDFSGDYTGPSMGESTFRGPMPERPVSKFTRPPPKAEPVITKKQIESKGTDGGDKKFKPIQSTLKEPAEIDAGRDYFEKVMWATPEKIAQMYGEAPGPKVTIYRGKTPHFMHFGLGREFTSMRDYLAGREGMPGPERLAKFSEARLERMADLEKALWKEDTLRRGQDLIAETARGEAMPDLNYQEATTSETGEIIEPSMFWRQNRDGSVSVMPVSEVPPEFFYKAVENIITKNPEEGVKMVDEFLNNPESSNQMAETLARMEATKSKAYEALMRHKRKLQRLNRLFEQYGQ